MKPNYTNELEQLDQWKKAAPTPKSNDIKNDLEVLRRWHLDGQERLKGLYPLSARDAKLQQITRHYRDTLAEARGLFISVYGEELYATLTGNWTELVHVEELVYRAADRYPGLAPTRAEVQEDMARQLPDKVGHELSQGLILGEWLAIPRVGMHLMAAMRQPRGDSLQRIAEFKKSGEIDLGVIKLIREGNIGYLTLSNREFLNAEDDELNAAMEAAVDLALLDPKIELGVIRGDLMQHEKYRGRRVFCSGINLTKLYGGQISYMFYVTRELGLISKIFRGLLGSDAAFFNEVPDKSLEKPWISVVDSHAIGGGCQILLVSDYVIADSGSYFTIPARTEGFIPGIANLRLPRYTGQRLANRMIYRNYKVMANSLDGQKLADEVVDSNSINAAIDLIVEEFTQTGIRGMISNRKAFRHGAEPIDVFRNYMATFCCEQARCMFDPEIIQNLERFWIQRTRRVEKKIPEPVE